MILLILLLFNQTDIIDNITGIQKEIQILNLINGLELSENQNEKLVDIVNIWISILFVIWSLRFGIY
ncbi:unnamed protein product [marine sediment metagenome]|uniref:Uncharacterized protein n=1 Tax=marine sediment metagenome TaxID=412755 RepID=X1LLD6_9ZZZZ